DRQHPQLASGRKLIMNEVHRPSLVRSCGRLPIIAQGSDASRGVRRDGRKGPARAGLRSKKATKSVGIVGCPRILISSEPRGLMGCVSASLPRSLTIRVNEDRSAATCTFVPVHLERNSPVSPWPPLCRRVRPVPVVAVPLGRD